ncbi:hypothetical protein V1J52_24935 [Streptomyces sp. TRM 70351]|uniref:hypothetical protein n=1 Tax=Streptomyces sp. TRM 70351 TaxID=3116552 RepID=UPI002E7AE875|nr:hypothetical protein [Streptomyces sp. TRM 70351]MEE1931368.1 hypothetical protein [Streptomyces sp. TRM 70351]
MHDEQQQPASAPDEHRTSMRESGAFISARCSCGWRGPARRARSRAQSDALDHPDSAGG